MGRMTSQPSLSGISMDGMECIVTFLDLPDICSLRLVARSVSVKASQGVFKSHFHTKKIQLTSEQQLERAVSVAQQRRYANLLEHLTLASLPTSTLGPDAQKREHEQDSRLKLLHRALELFCLNSARGCLPPISLTVEGAGEDGPDRPRIWEAAASCFNTTMLALGTSKLPIEALDVFSSITCCSLACDQIAAMLAKVNISTLTDSLRGLQHLSISLTYHETRKPESEYKQSLTFGQANTKAICQFLQSCCPTLQDLQLHWYGTYPAYPSEKLTEALSEEKSFFDRIAQSCRFPSLNRCTLKGISTSSTALLSFLHQAQQLRRLEMDGIHLDTRGKFRPIFAHLTQDMPRLEYVHLDNLFEEQLIYFNNAPGKPHFPSSGRRGNGPNAVTRRGVDVRNSIEYRFSHGVALGSPQANNWAREIRRQYGPSDY